MPMRLKKEELKRQGKIDTEGNEVADEDIGVFGVTKDHMLKAAEIPGKEYNSGNSGIVPHDY